MLRYDLNSKAYLDWVEEAKGQMSKNRQRISLAWWKCKECFLRDHHTDSRWVLLGCRPKVLCMDKINRSPGCRVSMATHRFRAPQKSLPLNRHLIILSPFLLRLMDGILTTDYCHIFKLFFYLFFLVGLGVVLRRLTTSLRKLWTFVDQLILSTTIAKIEQILFNPLRSQGARAGYVAL